MFTQTHTHTHTLDDLHSAKPYRAGKRVDGKRGLIMQAQ